MNFRLGAFVPWSVAIHTFLPSLQDDHELLLRVSGGDCSDGKIFRAKTARSEEAQSRGLSQRTDALAPDEAMLFVYTEALSVSFWMKNTWVPLAIGFFDPEGTFIRRYSMPVETDPSRPSHTYSSGEPVGSALEVSSENLSVFVEGAVLCVEVKSPPENQARSPDQVVSRRSP